MAGTINFGAVLARIVVVNKSSARPEAIRAIKSAVAGATTIRSAFSPSETCETESASCQTSLRTGRADKASQVALPTKLRLDGVGTTVTRNPRS